MTPRLVAGRTARVNGARADGRWTMRSRGTRAVGGEFGQVLHVQVHAAVSGTAIELLRRQESVLGEGKRDAE
jgi:hypothetical protein